MSDIDLETATLKITLGDIIQQFTEEDLQKEMPVFMQDIDADTKEFIDTYQLYLSEGNFLEAESYRNSHPELETRIWDSFKANAFMAYAAFVYLYAKDKKQQCILSEIIPPSGNGEDIIGQVEGDIWFRIDGIKDGVINTTPFRKLEDGTYQEFAVAPKLEFSTEDDIIEICDSNIKELSRPEALINNENLKIYNQKIYNIFFDYMKQKFEEIEKDIQDLNSDLGNGREVIINSLTSKGFKNLTNDSTFDQIANAIDAQKFVLIGKSTEILNNNSTITGGWSGSNSMTYNYDAKPSITYTTKNSFSFDSINSVILNANFGYYADDGRTDGAKLTINILKNGSVIATNNVSIYKSGFSYGTEPMSITVNTSSITGNCQVQCKMEIIATDGSHVKSTSSFTSCYLNS